MTPNSYASDVYYLHRILETLRGNAPDGIPMSLLLGPSESHIGLIGGVTKCIDVTPTLSVAGARVTGDYVGQTATPMTFANAARVNMGTGVIVGCTLIDGDLQSIAGELWLFDRTFVPPTDNAAWTITDAEAATVIGVVPFSTYYASAANSVAPVGNLTIAFQTAVGSKNIYGAYVTRGAPTYTSGNLSFRLRILQD